MRIILLTLVAGLCLAAVSANGGAFVQPEEVDFEYVPEDYADGIVDIEAFGFFSVVKLILRTLKGVNCSIQAVIIMKSTAEQAIFELNGCGGAVTQQVQNILNTLNTIVSICNDIINLNQNVCNSNNTNGNTSNNCFAQVLGKMFSLYNNIQQCISLIKNVPTTGSDASLCVTLACKNVSNTFMQFPTFVSNCSKLTSN